MSESYVRSLVLRVRDVKEIDQVVIFLESSDVKRSGFAKGAKHSKKRFVNTLVPLALIKLKYRQTNRGIWLEDSRLEKWFIVGSESPLLLGVKHAIREVLLKFLPENDPHIGVFDLSVKTLSVLEQRNDFLNTLIIFLLRFGFISGYLPDFNKCSICGNDLVKAKRWVWQLEPFRATCASHRLSGSLKWEWDLEVLRILQCIANWPVDRLWNLRVSARKQKSLFKNIVTWLEVTFNKEIKSFKWIEQNLNQELYQKWTGPFTSKA